MNIKPKIGISSSVTYKENPSPFFLIDVAVDLGVEIVELYLEEVLDNNIEISNLRKYAERSNIEIQTHLSDKIDLSQKLDLDRLNRLSQSIHFSKMLGSKVMTVHPGYYFSDQLVKNLKMISKMISFSLENGWKNRELCRTTEEYIYVFEQLKLLNAPVKATYDVGRSFQMGYTPEREISRITENVHICTLHLTNHVHNSTKIVSLDEGVIDIVTSIVNATPEVLILETETIEQTKKSLLFLKRNGFS